MAESLLVATTMEVSRMSGEIIALKAQLDAVAEALGEPRMNEAEGYHYEAVKELMGEVAEMRRQLRDVPIEPPEGG